MSLSIMLIENMVCSALYDQGVAVPCGLQYGEVCQNLWNNWFPLVDQINDGQSKKPNKNKLSLWRDGRGSFTDLYSLQDDSFLDVKCLKAFKCLKDQKFELWAGSPVAGEKRKDAMEMTRSEVVQTFIKNKESHQVYKTLTSQDKPYILMVAFPEMKLDGTWQLKCTVINVSAYLKYRAKNFYGGKSKSGISGLIYRTKSQTSIDYNESISARVEIKIWHTLKELVDLGLATNVQSIAQSFKEVL